MGNYLQQHGGAPLDHPRRCTAHRQDGNPCRRYAIRGGFVCRVHGGGSQKVQAKARERLALAQDRMIQELLGIATGAESEAVRLAAVRDALDRAGLSAKRAVEVGVELKPYEQVLNDIVGVAHITRAESPARQGLPPGDGPRTSKPEPVETVDAEVVPDSRALRLGRGGEPQDGDERADAPRDRSASRSRPLGDALAALEDATPEAGTAVRRARVVQVRRVRRR